MDIFERLAMPFGLVRFGVAPDHQKIKNVVRVFDRLAGDPRVRLFGNVEFGAHVSLEDLRRHYHEVCIATGAQSDRNLGIPGDDLGRSHGATEFVAWYNGHPEYRDREFDLSVERVAIVGVGNVAVDVARILCRTPDELATTDIADHALAALRGSRVRVVYLLGRRGPAQAAFTTPEVKELGDLPGADVETLVDEVTLDPESREDIERDPDRSTLKKVEILQEFATRAPSGKARRLVLRFLVSPTELLGDEHGNVRAMRLVHNALERDRHGTLRPKPTGLSEELPVDMVFRSVGYRGTPVSGLPFDQRRGIVPNDRGRVIDPAAAAPIPGVYVSGWIKRGPTGVIGTNKPDAAETVACMLEDVETGVLPTAPEAGDREAVSRLVRERQPQIVTYEDWRRLDAHESAEGAAAGRPRVKLITLAEVFGVLGR